MPKEIKTFNHGLDLIRLDPIGGKNVIQGLPTELHLKENGTLTNGPSLAIVINVANNRIIGQISIEMLNESLNELGYQILKL